MTGRIIQIGFSKRIRLEWLEKTANLVQAGNDKVSIKSALQDLLKNKVSVGKSSERGSGEKIITILMKVWLNVPKKIEPFRVEGLEILKQLPRPERITVHWGMVMAVYPFWASVATQVGRLLKLQGFMTAAHVQRRMKEQYGDRELVYLSTRKILRSYVDWGVLQDTKKKGVYSQQSILTIKKPELVSWLIEAALVNRANGSAILKDVIESPNLFPFSLSRASSLHLIPSSSRIDLFRQGSDDNLLVLKNEKG